MASARLPSGNFSPVKTTPYRVSEISAVMGLTGLESLPEFVEANKRNYEAYRQSVKGLPGVSLYQHRVTGPHNYQYLVVEIDEAMARKEPVLSDEEALHLIRRARTLVHPDESGNGFARRYFEAMQRDPGTVLAHRDMLMVMEEL